MTALATREISHLSPRQVAQVNLTADQAVSAFDSIGKLGIGFRERALSQAAEFFAMDATQSTITTPNIGVPLQYLQTVLPGMVRTLTQPRLIDELVGVTIAGNWEDAEVIAGIIEPTGTAAPYGDLNNIPFANFNYGFNRYSVVRAELGLEVSRLEEARAARINVNMATEKRNAVSIGLELFRNNIGFNGFNNGANRTFGFLNSPDVPAYYTVAATGTGASTLWSTKSYDNITADLRTAAQQLRQQSLGYIDPMRDSITLALPLAVMDYLSVQTALGYTVRQWIKDNYPNWRIIAIPQFNAANGGANVFYLYAERLNDGSTDDGRVFDQIVQVKQMMLGAEQKAKRYIEDYVTATAGIIAKRPLAIVRASGV